MRYPRNFPTPMIEGSRIVAVPNGYELHLNYTLCFGICQHLNFLPEIRDSDLEVFYDFFQVVFPVPISVWLTAVVDVAHLVELLFAFSSKNYLFHRHEDLNALWAPVAFEVVAGRTKDRGIRWIEIKVFIGPREKVVHLHLVGVVEVEFWVVLLYLTPYTVA